MRSPLAAGIGGVTAAFLGALCCDVGMFIGAWVIWPATAFLMVASIWNLLPTPKHATTTLG